MNVILAPFIVIYLLLLYFFRYFEVIPPCKLIAHESGVPQESRRSLIKAV
jgi:hypothetical protein